MILCVPISGVGDGETGVGLHDPWVDPFELRIFCDSLKPHKANHKAFPTPGSVL